MKMLQLFLSSVFLLTTTITTAQHKLPESSRGSAKSIIYTIDKDNLRQIYLKDKVVSEVIPGRYITEFPKGNDYPILPRGNYMIVNAVGNKLNFTDYTVDDLHFSIVQSDEIMLCLYDSSGNTISDATVKRGANKLKFDKTTQTYNSKKVKHKQVLEINNNGVYHYIIVEKAGYYSYKTNFFKNLWNRCFHNYNYYDTHTGFVVFSKPKYKPGETVKLKGYVARSKDKKPYDKPVNIRLTGSHPINVDTVLTNIAPYRPGMYEYEFELSDKLNLSLDMNYRVSLEPDKKRHLSVSDRFFYEDYELQGIRFTMQTDKDEYGKGDSVNIKFNAKDINGMDVYNGKVEILVESLSLKSENIKNFTTAFIPDTLWTHTLFPDNRNKLEVTLPDSIFPAGVSFGYNVSAIYLSDDNEKKTVKKLLTRIGDDFNIDFSLKKGILTITGMQEGESQQVSAEISIEGDDGNVIGTKSVILPHTMPLPWFASRISVKANNTTGYYPLASITEYQLDCKFYRQNDSIILKVDNPSEIPFRYTVVRDKSTIARGYSTRLDYATKDKNRGYSMKLSYLLGGSEKTIVKSLPFVQQNISMDISTPTTVYPGQKSDVHISVTDKNGKPVGNVDITAYSFTSKFDNNSTPNIAIRGKQKNARKFRQENYFPKRNTFVDRRNDLDWNRWKETMALDTIAYYSFLYPADYYVYTEPTPDRTTLVSPYVVIDGNIQMVHMLWIDDRLYYTSAAMQSDVYTFSVEPGKHNLRFRLYDRDVSVHNVFVKEKQRNIFSFNGGLTYMKMASMDNKADYPLVIYSRKLDHKEYLFPNAAEKKLLTDQLITLDNNFGAIRLPNNHSIIDVPAYIKSDDVYYYVNHTPVRQYSAQLRAFINAPSLLGPFPKRSNVNGMGDLAYLYRDNNDLVTMIDLSEGGNRYTVYNNYQKIKSWSSLPFKQDARKYSTIRDFREMPLSVDDILKHSQERMLSIMKRSYGPAETKSKAESSARLILNVGNDINDNQLTPALIFIVHDEIDKYQLYYGATRNFLYLPSGRVEISLVFNDKTSCTKSIELHNNGWNYLNIDSVTYDKDSDKAATAFRIFNRELTIIHPRNPYADKSSGDSIVFVARQSANYYTKKGDRKADISGFVHDASEYPVAGASISVRGKTIGTIADLDGYFELSGVVPGDNITVAYIGYDSKEITYSGEKEYNFVLDESSMALEVVTIGFGRQTAAAGTIDTIENSVPGVLAGMAAGVRIRGTSSLPDSPPLILINGLPYDGNIDNLDQSNFQSFTIIKDASAMAIYGSRAANGVIMIETNDLIAKHAAAQFVDNLSVMEGGNSMRRNFHDDAFWQPRLTTNDKGEVSFSVTYPDDITSWDAHFIAIGNKKQSDKQKMTIKSFKMLSASLSTPRFAVRGDSVNITGRITNHLSDTIFVSRKIEVDGHTQEERVGTATSHIDHIPVTVHDGDSLTIAYSMLLPNGYFDGEERSIPIIEQGVLQSFGEFKVINDTVTHTFTPVPGLGTVTVNAESSSLNMFLEEIDKVDVYPFMCNEQIASKVKALLAKKRITEMFNMTFTDDKKIKNLVGTLKNNRNKEGKWGWWNKSDTEQWITDQITSALLDAERAGFSTCLDTVALCTSLAKEIKAGLSDLQLTTTDMVPFSKQELLNRLIALKQMNALIEFKNVFEQINQQLPDRTLMDKLKTMETMAAIGLKDRINIDSLMSFSNKTMLGSIYWGEEKEGRLLPGSLLTPYQNNTCHTLIAYKILKTIGEHAHEMEKVRSYFLERRRGGMWSNTYESSRIIETIMPDMLTPEQPFTEATITVNGRKITRFPFTEKIESHAPVLIRKEGTMPLFAAVYQQAWNPAPEPEATKGFAIKSVFTANGDTIAHLTAGKKVKLNVSVTVDARAEYIQIEVPIPAGCSYDSKSAMNFRKEAHREHYKNKVVIFCNRLTKGEHHFTIELLPRFTGKYSLNPAKAELMYFPLFYGNNEIKKILIKE